MELSYSLELPMKLSYSLELPMELFGSSTSVMELSYSLELPMENEFSGILSLSLDELLIISTSLVALVSLNSSKYFLEIREIKIPASLVFFIFSISSWVIIL